MEVDEAVVDLSISSSGRPTAPTSAGFHPSYPTISPPYQHLVAARRILRPRIEPRSYVEAHEAPFLLNGNGGGVGVRTNGNADYTSSDESELGGEMPPLSAIKEFSPTELKHRERGLRRLREELRAEEMKLVLLKKLKQSQQLKENVAVLPPGVPASALPPAGLPSGLSITPTVVKTTVKQQPPPAAHSRHGNTVAPHHKPGGLPLPGNVQQPAGSANLMRAVSVYM